MSKPSSHPDKDKGERLQVIAARFSRAENREAFQVLARINSQTPPKFKAFAVHKPEVSAANAQTSARIAMDCQLIGHLELQAHNSPSAPRLKRINPLAWPQQRAACEIDNAIAKLADNPATTRQTSNKPASLITHNALPKDAARQGMTDEAGNRKSSREGASDLTSQYKKKQEDCDAFTDCISRLLEAQGWTLAGSSALLNPGASSRHAIGVAPRPRRVSSTGSEPIEADDLQGDKLPPDSPWMPLREAEVLEAKAV